MGNVNRVAQANIGKVANIFALAILWFLIASSTTGCGSRPLEASARGQETEAIVSVQFDSETAQSVDGILTVAATATEQVVRSGAAVQVDVTVQIRPGFHIYGDVDEDGPFTALAIESAVDDERVTVSPATLPLATATMDGRPIYRDSIKMTVKLTPPNGFLGSFVLLTRLQFQACNDLACFPPDTIQVDLPVQISPTKPSDNGVSP